ncbi:leucine-rich repeat domain-containing protein [Massilia rubra]|uniref:leucine-rich repeat domain-containing protein n=1 Tax=Massilia rubra TaxID=2607910 RepID=UPI001651F9EC|nr:leucine-rich repeat domain-containing protein [Massilia rubra]
MKFNRYISRIDNEVQDRSSDAWKALCRYIDEIDASGADEFAPREALGPELYAGIFTLPESIGKLKRVTKVHLYGSKLKRIPPEIGDMTALTHFDVYTSYGLQWFPYELTRCKNLVNSRVSTRALYGNYKHRLHFPQLNGNPVRYHGDTVKCSVCGTETGYDNILQLWISLKVGTDVFPMLVNSCSRQCSESLPTPHHNYVQQAHRGGRSIAQPPDENARWQLEQLQAKEEPVPVPVQPRAAGDAVEPTPTPKLPLLKPIWKIWER